MAEEIATLGDMQGSEIRYQNQDIPASRTFDWKDVAAFSVIALALGIVIGIGFSR